MATQTLAAADAILKELYVGPVIEQINQNTFLLDQIDRDVESVDLTGRRAIIPLHTNRNRGRGSIADAGTLPAAGRQAYQDAIVPIRYHQYGIELSDAAIQGAVTKNNGAFLNILEAETKGVAQDMKKDLNRQAFGTGDGLLGTTASAAAGVITMAASTNSREIQYIQVGDTVDVLVKATGATSFGVVGTTVTARSVASNTITVSPAVGTPASIDGTFGVYVTGNRNQESDGLRNIIATGRTLHSINSSTAGNEFWNGTVTNVGASSTATVAATESQFEQLIDNVGIIGNGDVELFLTTRGIKRRLADQYQSQKRFNDTQATTIHGGYSAIMVAGGSKPVPVVADDDAPKNFAFAIRKDALRWFEQVPPGWLQQSNSSVFQLKTGSAGTYVSVWQAWWRWYAALGSVAPNRLGLLQFCQDDNTI